MSAQKLYVGLAPAHHLPLAPHSVSVVMVPELATGDLTAANLDAWVTALTPERGVAALGNADPEALDAQQLQNQLAGRPELQVEYRPGGMGGTFAMCHKAALAGSDPWPQKFHDATNVRATLDTALDAPYQRQLVAATDLEPLRDQAGRL